MRKPLAIIGMSPGNSYFKDYEVRFLLKESIERFGKCAVMVADVPAIATYEAMGYDKGRARNKAIPKGNNLKNRTRRLAQSLGYSDEQVRIIDWAEEVEPNLDYQKTYQQVLAKYQSNPSFADSVRTTSRDVLIHTERDVHDLDAAANGAAHYLLSELAFMEFAPQFFNCKRVCYLYHRNWQVYEDYVHGRHDGESKPYLDFLLLEAPYETFSKMNDVAISNPLHDTYSRVMQSGVLRAAFGEYPPVMQRVGEKFSGIFYDIICGFAKKHELKIEWVEETGYGVVIDGLSEGRFDIFCSATWPTPERHKKASLSRPVYYSDVGIWVRAECELAGKDWITLNDPNYRIAVTEGDISHQICLTDFTFAKWVRVPQLGKVRTLLEFVADDRADATLVEQMTYDAYAKGLSSPLLNLARDKPIRRYANSFLVGKDQNDFLEIFDQYLEEIAVSGETASIIDRYLEPSEQIGIYIK